MDKNIKEKKVVCGMYKKGDLLLFNLIDIMVCFGAYFVESHSKSTCIIC
jgi:hypothetical protein